MTFARAWTSGAEGLLPAAKLHAPTVALLAIMTFVMLVVAAAGLALANAAGAVAGGVENRYVVEIPAAATPDLPRALAAVRSAPGVRAASAIPESEMRATLGRWLGEAASSSDLPVPALVTLELAPGADQGAIEAAVRRQVPSARLLSESGELRPLLGSLHALQWVALALVLMMAAAAASAVVLATRGALDTHRTTIEIMHGIGATDAQLSRLFERKIAVDAIAGAVAGTVAAGIVLLLAGGGAAVLAGELMSIVPLGALDLAFLLLLPLAVVILATLVARWTLLRALRETL